MSQVHKRTVSVLKDVEDSLRRARYVWLENLPLSERNQRFVADLLTITAHIWYDVSANPALINKRWVNAVSAEPISRLVDLLKDVDYWIISQQFSSYGDFKRHLQVSYPGVGQVLSPLSRNISTFYSCGEGLPRLRTALRFATRANFPEPIGLEEDAWSEWQERCLTEWDEVDMRQEAQLLSEIYPRRKSVLQLDGFIGRFGPGASADADSTALIDKYRSFGSDPMLRYLGHRLDFQPHDMPIHSDKQIRTGKLHFVPKQLNKLRTVTMEPASLMYFQLGIADCAYSRLKKTRWGRHIDLEHAELNSDLAWLGSLDGSFATIDLSAASDTVRYRMVQNLFRDTCLRECLVGSRSRQVEYNGEVYTPTYFAPMGSGLCFLVECLTFASIVDAVMRKNGDRRAWRVYGDDIVVPDDRYDEVVNRLTDCGFLVNEDKSFHGRPGFRESCGGDYYLGEDVRPVYVSRFWEGLPRPGRNQPSLVESNIDLANRLFGYTTARQRVISSLIGVKPIPLFDSDGEIGIFSPSPTNYRAKARWNEDLQRVEYRTGCTVTRYAKDEPEHERIRYFETLRAMASSPTCVEREPISISHQRRPIWSGTWRSPSPGWCEGLDRPGVSQRKCDP